MKFFKISAIWLVALVTPITLAVVFGSDDLTKMLISVIYGYLLMIIIASCLKLLGDVMPISKSVWWSVGINAVSCVINNASIELSVGSMIGIAISYQLLKLSKHIGEEPALA